jgi:hypothetical protein
MNGPLADEEVWATACDLIGRSPLRVESIDLEVLRERLAAIHEQALEEGPVFGTGQTGTVHDLRGLWRRVTTMQEHGQTQLTSPLPGADVEPTGGWIGEFFSDSRLLEIATEIYRRTTVAYCQLVDRWMPTLASHLEHYALMPARVIGFVGPGRGAPHGLGPIPQLAGYLEPLAEGAECEISMRLSKGFDYSIGETVYQQQRLARPHAARWLTGTIGGMSFEVGERYPVADATYDWLAHDLKRLGLGGSLTRGPATTPLLAWDLD